MLINNLDNYLSVFIVSSGFLVFFYIIVIYYILISYKCL